MTKKPYADWYAPLDDCLAELFRRMTIEQKFALHERMSQNLRLFVYERLKQFHPEWSELELRRELLRWLLGMELPPDMQMSL